MWRPDRDVYRPEVGRVRCSRIVMTGCWNHPIKGLPETHEQKRERDTLHLRPASDRDRRPYSIPQLPAVCRHDRPRRTAC